MTATDIVRAWKDPDYRDEILGQACPVPVHPAGMVELDEIEDNLPHGRATWLQCTFGGWICFSVTVSLILQCTGQSICFGTCNDGNTHGCCS